jgi:hypothetical protein
LGRSVAEELVLGSDEGDAHVAPEDL